jgi:Tfp pilus assembly PilM family ATPase
MVYLSIDNNTIQLLALSKTLLGQYNISNFSKKHATELIKDGVFVNVDLVASSIKEAFTAAQPQAVNEKSVFLVLPQESFAFGRFVIPSDMSEAAVDPFIQDKARSELGINISTTYYDYIISSEGSESVVLFYGLSNDVVQSVEEILQLDLRVVGAMIPVLFYQTREIHPETKHLYVRVLLHRVLDKFHRQ